MNTKKITRPACCLLTLAAISLGGCRESGNEKEGTESFAIQMFSPNPLVVGQPVSIVGNRLDRAVAVIFPAGIEVSDIKKIGTFEIQAIVPEGIQAGGYLRVKSTEEEIESEMEVRIASPAFTSCSPSSLGSGSILTLKGQDLNALQKAVFPDGPVVEAIDFVRKSNDEIKLRIPREATGGQTVIRFIASGGQAVVSPVFFVEQTEEEVPPAVDPVTDDTRMILDFQVRESDWHGPDWDNWAGAYDQDQAKADGFVTLNVGQPGYWIVGCNHTPPGGWPSVDPNRYVLKVDIKTTRPIAVTGGYELRFMIGGTAVSTQLIVSADGQFIQTLNNDWQTLRIEIGEILPNPTGSSGDFGILHGYSDSGMDFSGLCFDNLRFDPK